MLLMRRIPGAAGSSPVGGGWSPVAGQALEVHSTASVCAWVARNRQQDAVLSHRVTAVWTFKRCESGKLAMWQSGSVDHCLKARRLRERESHPTTQSLTAIASTVSQGCVSDETAGSLMPNLGTELVGKWLTTMDGNLRWRQQGGAGWSG